MWRENRTSILLAGIPPARMTAGTVHIEHDDDTAYTHFVDGRVESLHTPQDAFHRVHELMHANKSDPVRMKEQYDGLMQSVCNIAEDCRIHQVHWPWRGGETPDEILKSTRKFLRDELKEINKSLVENPEMRGDWGDFAIRLRQVAVQTGLGDKAKSVYRKADFKDYRQAAFASRILSLIRKGEEGQAAFEMQTAFFDPPPPEIETPILRDGIKREGGRGPAPQPHMEIIDLPLTEIIPEAKIGYRRASSGSRLHRPSLRKLVLPQRLFVRRTPRMPGGTILVDASGSMGSFDVIEGWIKRAPFGTIAYYAGNGRSGWLWVCAKNGRRAAEFPKPPSGGNTVDGPAMTWLLSQPGPHVMITDRGFCDVMDSDAQIQRLARLERQGKIRVYDYAHDDE